MDDPLKSPDAEPQIYGLLAEFATAEELVAAAQEVAEAGYRRLDAYSPMPVDGLSEAIGFHQTRLPQVVLLGGVCGGLLGYGLQWYTMVVSYPLNIGGRPLHSWPAFIPVTFELTILGAALAAVLGMLALNGLPRPHHPLFGVPDFNLATQNRFFLCIEASDAIFDPIRSEELLRRAGAVKVTLVAM